jgi:hypothetical protein
MLVFSSRCREEERETSSISTTDSAPTQCFLYVSVQHPFNNADTQNNTSVREPPTLRTYSIDTKSTMPSFQHERLAIFRVLLARSPKLIAHKQKSALLCSTATARHISAVVSKRFTNANHVRTI